MDTPAGVLTSRLDGKLQRLDAVWCDCTLTVPERAVLTVLVLRADAAKGWTCWPSLTRIARDTGLGRSTVARVLDRLAELGWLDRTRRPRSTSTLYRILTPTEPAGSPGAGLVPERDYSRSGTQVVPERDGGSPAAGPEVGYEVGQETLNTPLGEAAAPPAGRKARSGGKRTAKPKAPADPLSTAANELVVQLDALLRSHGVPGGIPSGQPWAKQVRIARQQLAECGNPPADAAAALAWVFEHGSDFRRARLVSGSGRMLALADCIADWLQRDSAGKGNGRRFRDQLSGQPVNDPNGPWARKQADDEEII